MRTFMTLSGVGAPGIFGHPSAFAFDGTSVPSLTRGYWLRGGFLPFVTQSVRATINARRASPWGFGFAACTNPATAWCVTAKPPPAPPNARLALSYVRMLRG